MTDRFDCAAILFDLDGVLVDSSAAVERAWSRWAAEVEIGLDTVMAAVHGRRTADTIRAVAPHLDAVAEAARLEAREATADGVAAYPGVAQLLGSLPAGRWAVVTSGSRPLASGRLAAAGLPLPAVVVTAEDVRGGKPDPEGYLAAAAALGSAPAHCVVVEDAPAGVEAARRAGMGVVALTTTHGSDELAGADAVVGSLADVTIAAANDRLRVTLGST